MRIDNLALEASDVELKPLKSFAIESPDSLALWDSQVKMLVKVKDGFTWLSCLGDEE